MFIGIQYRCDRGTAMPHGVPSLEVRQGFRIVYHERLGWVKQACCVMCLYSVRCSLPDWLSPGFQLNRSSQMLEKHTCTCMFTLKVVYCVCSRKCDLLVLRARPLRNVV